jgi:ketosteroid isomerase-like protein
MVRGGFDAFNRGDHTAWLAGLDEDYEIVPSDEWPDARVIRGGEALARHDLPRAKGSPRRVVHGSCRRPRSRRAVGVGDVAGERGAAIPRC